jgi:hypothetical protein
MNGGEAVVMRHRKQCPRVDLNKHIERGVKGLRIGILPEPELTQVEVPIRCLMEETLAGLVAEGAIVSEFAPPVLERSAQGFDLLHVECQF